MGGYAMSMYYYYYLGYWDENHKLVPYGPYDDEGNLHELFWYNYRSSIEVHREFNMLSKEDFSEKFVSAIQSLFELSYEDVLTGEWYSDGWGYMDLKDFVNGITSLQDLIRTGYWPADELVEFLSVPEEERADILYYGELSEPLSSDAYAAKVSLDHTVSSQYMFYSICNPYTDDYYRYLAHIKSQDLIDEWKYLERRYVICYLFA